jgi:glyoxylase-like metal-dependent hydrolase (beta-lactamase superfamily II)
MPMKSLVFAIACLCASALAAADDVRELAPGIWRIAGKNAAIDSGNGGVIATTGVIATGAGVIVIDPGPSARRAAALVSLIGSLTKEPVRWVIDTHPHPENVLGNSGFPEAVVIASAPAAALMKTRCTICLQRLVEQLGEDAMRGTTSRVPDRMVADGETATFGTRQLRFLVFANAHSRGDLAVLLPEEAILFAGGLVNDRRVPDMREAGLSSWIAAIDVLQKATPRILVPGHGSATDPALIARFSEYLTDLRTACDRDIARGGDAGSSGARLLLPAYAKWAEYTVQHPLNVAHAYREREDAVMFGDK